MRAGYANVATVCAEAGVEGYPHKSEPEEMRAERITLAGQVFEMR